MNQRLIVGLDLGSTHIRFAVGQLGSATERNPALSIVGAVAYPSQGIAKGVVTALEDAVASLSGALEDAERQVGVPIEEAIVGIGGTHISVVPAKSVIGVSRTDGEIQSEDLDRVLEAAKASVNPANHEILHVLSHGFTVDGQAGIKDPVGMHGIRLEASAHLIIGLAGNVRNMTKCVFRTGLDISSLMFGPLAAAETVTTSRERELGACVVNIGAAMTSVLVFEDGQLIHAAVIPVGADHITSDIAIGLRTSLAVAETIKIEQGNAVPDDAGRRDVIDLAPYGVDQEEPVPVRYVSEIIEARAEELFEKVEEELQQAGRSGLLPAGAVLTGGGAKLRGMVEVAKRCLRLPASVGAATQLSTPMPEIVHDPAFSTAAGLVQWGFDDMRREDDRAPRGRKLFASGGKAVGKMGGAFKKIFKSFIP